MTRSWIRTLTAAVIKVATSTLHLGHVTRSKLHLGHVTLHLGHVTRSKLHLGHVTLHLGHVIDGASRMKNKRFSCRRTVLRTDASIISSRTDEITTQPTTFRTERCSFDLAVEVFYPFYFYCLAYEITIT